MARTKNNVLILTVTLLIGIVLIALSLSFWYLIISPVVSLDTYSISRPSESKNIRNGSSLILNFGAYRFQQQDIFNKSRPVDYSINLSIKIIANTGPIDVTVYVRDNPIFNVQTNETHRTIWCNSTEILRLTKNNQTFPENILLLSNITSPIQVSLSDSLSGGITPYMVIQNLNATSQTSVSYIYNYKAFFRSSNGLPLAFFVAGVIIVVVESVVLLRRVIRRVRER